MPNSHYNIKKRGRCKACDAEFIIASDEPSRFCPFCGVSLRKNFSFAMSQESTGLTEEGAISLVSGHEPSDDAIQYALGSYQVIKSIGKGGMGEVLLAYDTTCGRQIALKRIRPDLLKFKQIANRFLKEARITSQLTHPAIIPIYSIHQGEEQTYYTMPFVEGENLKQTLRRAKELLKKGEHQSEKEALTFASIPILIRIFLSVCQAIAYAHSKSVLHRDIKPENVIVGKYGEVLILDWGLAKLLHQSENEAEESIEESHPLHHITLAGKVVGTVSYMAPERALGQPANVQTDIYSLGVILYQILTLRLPFKRGTLKEFRENLSKEVLIDPSEVAPYREIPKVLSAIALKCLSSNPEQRYGSVDELIQDLEGYMEGRSEWLPAATLKKERKSDWEFQENILIAEHTAITRTAEISEWVHLMISKSSFTENIRLETEVKLLAESHGIGLLFNIPESDERENINDGFCLWLGTGSKFPSKLLKSSIEVLPLPEILLKPSHRYRVKIEKIDHTITLSIDGKEEFSYISRTPISGTHVGILSRDDFYEMKGLEVSIGSQNIMVNCLAIPDAFLAHKEYHQALSEYRRIASAFPGRTEGREAILRSGITLLEEAKNTTVIKEAEKLFHAALDEFEKLHQTAGAPLEYLGKALVYEALLDIDEEIKCFELGFRRFPNHPLLHLLKEQILFRLIESSKSDRRAAYHFLLLSLCHLKDVENIAAVEQLMQRLIANWEPLPFLLKTESIKENLIISLAFWLERPFILEERIVLLSKEDKPETPLIFNAMMALYLLNEEEKLKNALQIAPELNPFFQPLLIPDRKIGLQIALQLSMDDPKVKIILLSLIDSLIDSKEFTYLDTALQELDSREEFLLRKIWVQLALHYYDRAHELFDLIPFEQLTQETSPYHFLYGIYLNAVEGSEIAKIHSSSLLEIPFPRTWILGSYAIGDKLDPLWEKKAFAYEKQQLKRQLTLRINA